MELSQRTNIFLYLSGLLLFLIGFLVAYFVLPGGMVTDSSYTYFEDSISTEKEESHTVSSSEDYERKVWDHVSVIELPEVIGESDISVEEALINRRSYHEYEGSSITLQELGQVLWSGQGITDDHGSRTAPSARRVYPSRLYVFVHNVDELNPGIYEYVPEDHVLGLIREGDYRSNWEEVTPQTQPQTASAVILQTADMSDEGFRKLALQESGHIGQNMYLQAESLGLGMTVMGGFDADLASDLLGLDEFEEVVYLIPIGNRIN